MKWFNIPGRVAVLGLLLAAGCGGTSESTEPKFDLTEKEMQHVKELQEHRAKEWAPPPKQ